MSDLTHQASPAQIIDVTEREHQHRTGSLYMLNQIHELGYERGTMCV